jgi:hypothetical protein
MNRWLVSSLSFCLSSCLLSGQTTAAPPQGQVPVAWSSVSPSTFATGQLYHALFKQVAIFQQMANALQAKGKNNSGALHEVKRRVGLTDAEEAALNTIAATSIAAFEAGEKSANAIVTQFVNQNAKGTPMPTALQQQYQAQKGQDLQAVLSAVQQLQTAFGQARFQILDNYVRTSVAKGVNTTPPELKYGKPSGLQAPVSAKQ